MLIKTTKEKSEDCRTEIQTDTKRKSPSFRSEILVYFREKKKKVRSKLNKMDLQRLELELRKQEMKMLSSNKNK